MPANTNAPPRLSPNDVLAARRLITNPQHFTDLPESIWRDVQETAWAVLRIEHHHRTAPFVLHLHDHQPGDAA